MRYDDPALRERLAAEYAVGSLHGRARARMRSLLRYDPAWRREVAQWEARLGPITDSLPERAPPARVWQAIHGRVAPAQRAAAGAPASAKAGDAGAAGVSRPATHAPDRASWWRPGWWRGLAVAMTLATVGLAIVLRTGGTPAPVQTAAAPGMMAILTDAGAQPTMLVSWPMQARGNERVEIRVRIIMDHPTMDPSTSWELWLMPSDPNGQPRSVGLVGLDREQRLYVDASMLKALLDAQGMALSNEPAGGSPTGLPTGQVIFRGPCIKT
jgi:anti-sigma-K factor RskA